LIFGVVYLDFFKIFGFQDYYSTHYFGLNREVVTTTTYNHFRSSEKFNSFIFGSSRSQAYKCEKWKNYLEPEAKPFHFDASGDGIWGISKKIEYIDRSNDTLKNALIVLDRMSLTITGPRSGHLFVTMPCVSQESGVGYYFEFLKASLNPKFLCTYVDFSIFKEIREYMANCIVRNKFKDRVDVKNCDIWDGWDQEIQEDSIGYYRFLKEKKVFYKRPGKENLRTDITPAEIAQLKSIKHIFDKHKTRFKIVISPIYDQIPMEENQIKLLEEVFGTQNIYNFSGKNELTEPIYNFYEASHYRPHVANQIMKEIYKDE
jgi:hypothetical protein